MKETIDTMVARAFEAIGNEDELMSFNIAIIVMRVQRKWRAAVRSKKMKKRLQQRIDRSKGISSLKVLIEKKLDTVTEVALAELEGKPWRFDNSPGLGILEFWALSCEAPTHTENSPEFSPLTLKSLANVGLGGLRRMTLVLGGKRATKLPGSNVYANPVSGSGAGSGLSNMVKRVTRLGGAPGWARNHNPRRLIKTRESSAGAEAALEILRRNTISLEPEAMTLEEMAAQALGCLDASDSSDEDSDRKEEGQPRQDLAS
jgi:hypothetical protein